MNLLDRAMAGASAAYRAFNAPAISTAPARDAVKLRSMPTTAPGRRAGKKRMERLAFDYRRWMPSDVENALALANGSGDLRQAASIGAYVKANPIVSGVWGGVVSTPWLEYGVKYSDEASAWLMGTDTSKGWREQITNPAELEAVAADDYNSGWGVGIFIWNEQKGRPEHVALDNAGARYLPGEDRYQYHGWNRVYDVEPGNGIWTLKTRVKSDPWRDGAWHKLAYGILDSLQGDIQRAVWMHVFAMPTILAKYTLGSSETQKREYTSSIIGSALRVIGVTPGFDLDFKQASAEGADTFKDVNERLERIVSIYVWGTIGLLAGGSGFSNSDLFEQMRSGVVGKEARRQAQYENEQIWPVVLDWAARAGHISRAAAGACIEYNPETPAVVLKKALAAKALTEVGYSADEAQMRVGLKKQAYGEESPTSGVRLTVAAPPPDEPEEPEYSEALAARMTERSLDECPHGETRSCRSCRVVRRFEVQDGATAYRPVWHAWTRRAA